MTHRPAKTIELFSVERITATQTEHWVDNPSKSRYWVTVALRGKTRLIDHCFRTEETIESGGCDTAWDALALAFELAAKLMKDQEK